MSYSKWATNQFVTKPYRASNVYQIVNWACKRISPSCVGFSLADKPISAGGV
jgi:hypothetical protein